MYVEHQFIEYFQHSDSLQLITFGTDKLIVVRQLSSLGADSYSSHRLTQIVSNFGPNCMTVVRDGSVLVGCQDRQLRMYSESGKLLRTLKGTVCEEGIITKVRKIFEKFLAQK